jgi:hypothetical protein
VAHSVPLVPYGYVYLILHRETGKIYVGQTRKKIAYRWKEHQYAAFTENRNNRLSRAIRKYRPDAFSVVELHRAFSKQELDEMEVRAIASHESTDRRYGFNIGAGGGVTRLFGEDNPHFGRSLSEEHATKLKDGFKAYRESGRRPQYIPNPERNRAISQSLLGNTRAKGIKKTPEHRAKIAEGRRRYWASKKSSSPVV